MASLYNYKFNNLTRIGNDKCGVTERDLQNNSFGSYTLKNFYNKECNMGKPINFATQQPNIFYNGSVGTSLSGNSGCLVDNDSMLRFKKKQNNPRARINLRQRMFNTVPYLGRGPCKPTQETKLQQGSYLDPKKNCKIVMEQSLGNNDVPLIPSLKATIQNPNNLIENMAVDGWIRGGIPSRELTRDNDYLKK